MERGQPADAERGRERLWAARCVVGRGRGRELYSREFSTILFFLLHEQQVICGNGWESGELNCEVN